MARSFNRIPSAERPGAASRALRGRLGTQVGLEGSRTPRLHEPRAGYLDKAVDDVGDDARGMSR